MKKLVLLAVLTLMGASAYAQPSATVLLNNYDANMPIYLLQQGTLAGANTFVQLLGGPAGGTLAPVTVAGRTDSVFSLADDPGFFDAGVGVVPGVAASGQADFQLVAWQGADLATAENIGRSAVWSQGTGSWDGSAVPPPAPSGPALNVPGSFTIIPIPEPSTIALGILGAAALLIRRRK